MKTIPDDVKTVPRALLIVFIFFLIIMISMPLYIVMENFIFSDDTVNIDDYSPDLHLKATNIGHWFNRSYGSELYSIKNVSKDEYIVQKVSVLNETSITVYKNKNLNENPLACWSIKEIGIYFNNNGGDELGDYYLRNDLSLFDNEQTTAIRDFLTDLDYSNLPQHTSAIDEKIGYFRVVFFDKPFVWDSVLYYNNEGFYILYEDREVVFSDALNYYFLKSAGILR